MKLYIRKRGRKYYFCLYYTDSDGVDRRVERCGGETPEEARAAGECFYADILGEQRYFGNAQYLKFRDFLTKVFMPECVEPFLRPATQRSYETQIRCHIIPALGDLPIGHITLRRVQQFVLDMSQTCAHSTVEMTVRIIGKALRFAQENCNLDVKIVTNGVRIPPAKEAKREQEIFSPEEVREMLAHFGPGHSFHVPIAIAYHTGLRQGECFALKWEDVNLDRLTISVHATMYDNGGMGEYQPAPKTASSVRTISISPQLAEILTAARELYAEKAEALGIKWHHNDYVCRDDWGNNMTASRMRYFTNYCKTKFGRGSFHLLRHTHATMLLEGGLPMDLVARRLGHSTVVTTANIYAHVTERREDEVRAAIAKIV